MQDSPDPRLTRAWRLLPAAALLLAVAVLTHQQTTGYAAIGLYWATLVWSALIPGMLVHRALRGRPSTMLADVAFGGATGLALQLVAWAVFTAMGIQQWLVLWPVPLVVAFVAVPRLRGCWSIAAYERHLHPVSALGLVFGSLMVTRGALTVASRSPLPGIPALWEQDLYFHLGIVGELMRAVPPTMPQIAGEPLSYHWFSHAHIAAMTLMTGLDTPLVITRLWMQPIVILSVLCVAAAGQYLTGRAWPGVLAAVLGTLQLQLLTGWWTYHGANSYAPLSPSQQFATPFMMLALPPLIDLLRGRRLRAGPWAVLGLALVALAGAKASVIPVMVCGMALALAVAVIWNRRRAGGIALGFGVVVAAMIVTWPIVSGGAGGVRIQFFATLRRLDPWQRFAGDPIALGLLPPGMDGAGAWPLLAVLMAGWVVSMVWLIPGLRALSRTDLSGWMLLGTGIGGFAAMQLVNQDGLSQVYFMMSAVIAWQLLVAWGVKLLVDDAARSFGALVAVASLAAGITAGMLVSPALRIMTPPADGSLTRTIVPSLVPWLVIAAVWVAVILWRRRIRPALCVAGGGFALGAALGTTSIVAQAKHAVGDVVVIGGLLLVFAGSITLLVLRKRYRSIVPPRLFAALAVSGALIVAAVPVFTQPMPQPAQPRPEALVSADEAEAARWLRDNSDPFDVVASNVHCVLKRMENRCESRSFWVSAFTERRVLVESWAYTPEAHANHGRDGWPYSRQPFHDPELLALNDSAFTDPTPEVLEELRGRGVRFLFANDMAGEVSPRLDELATKVFAQGPVTIYEI